MKSAELEGESVRGTDGNIQLVSEVGGGNEGHVYKVAEKDSTVAKIFNKEYREEKREKVEAMVRGGIQPRDETYEQQKTRSIMWPQDVLYSDDEFLGYTMPEQDTQKSKNAFVYAIADLSDSSIIKRLGVALNLAIMVGNIHKEGHAIGDFNHENILIERGFVSLIDCDSFHINGGNNIYKGDTYKPRYAPPEKRPSSLEEVQKADRFGLSIHIFQFLMEGTHPYLATGQAAASGDWDKLIQENPFPYAVQNTEVEPHQNDIIKYRQIPKSVREKFDKCFVKGKDNTGARPAPEEWIRALREASGLSNETNSTSEVDTTDGPSTSTKTGSVESESSSIEETTTKASPPRNESTKNKEVVISSDSELNNQKNVGLNSEGPPDINPGVDLQSTAANKIVSGIKYIAPILLGIMILLMAVYISSLLI